MLVFIISRWPHIFLRERTPLREKAIFGFQSIERQTLHSASDTNISNMRERERESLGVCVLLQESKLQLCCFHWSVRYARRASVRGRLMICDEMLYWAGAGNEEFRPGGQNEEFWQGGRNHTSVNDNQKQFEDFPFVAKSDSSLFLAIWRTNSFVQGLKNCAFKMLLSVGECLL